jgi:hypothetical protein
LIKPVLLPGLLAMVTGAVACGDDSSTEIDAAVAIVDATPVADAALPDGSVTDAAMADAAVPDAAPASCYASAACDPLAPADCDDDTGVGSACDLNTGGVLQCFPPPNSAGLGDMCDSDGGGPFCSHGLTCGESNICVEYCCSQGDCTTGTCTEVAAGISTCQ